MAEKQPIYLYRSIHRDLLDLYKGNPSKIPNLEGENFLQFSRLNPYPYNEKERYLHFLDSRLFSKQYAEDTEKETGKETCVVIFKFDPEIIEKCRTTGKFIVKQTKLVEETIDLNEYIIPAELYDPSKNFVGVLEKDTEKQKPNVFAVLPEREVEYYATDLDSASGLDYLDEEMMSSLLPEDVKACKERALHVFVSRKQAENYEKELRLKGKRMEVVPFTIDEKILNKYISFKTDCGQTQSKEQDKEFLIPISEISEKNYYEEGKKSTIQEVRYDPDDYSSGWFFS